MSITLTLLQILLYFLFFAMGAVLSATIISYYRYKMKEEVLLKAITSMLLSFKIKKIPIPIYKYEKVESVKRGRGNKTNNRFSHRGKNGRFEPIKK